MVFALVLNWVYVSLEKKLPFHHYHRRTGTFGLGGVGWGALTFLTEKFTQYPNASVEIGIQTDSRCTKKKCSRFPHLMKLL